MSEPSIAGDYDDRGARAAHAVLLELGQVLGAHREAMVVIGGSVPSLLMPNADPAHVGTLDIDLDLDPERLSYGDAAIVLPSRGTRPPGGRRALATAGLQEDDKGGLGRPA